MLFNTFDNDRNGVVDLGEMFSGLSVICNGSTVEKLYSAFKLYDTSRDGIIQFEELNHYFHAIFSVIL